MAVLLVSAAVVPAGAAATTAESQESEAYAGAHVSFQVEGSTVSNYQVDGDVFAEQVAVESQSAYESRLDLAADARLKAVTNVQGASTSLGAQTETRATVETGGSAEMRSHDNKHGHLVVDAGDESQYVQVNLTEDANAESHSESRLTVAVEDGREGTFVVVGDGEVTVNEQGDVSAALSEDAQLVLRTYSEDRDENDEQVEQYIANGTATAEAHVMERDGEIVHDTVEYGQETSVSASQSAENTATVTVDRTQSEGKVLVTSVAEEAVGSVDDLAVTVDSEAAAQVESYSELEGAIGNEPRYMVVSETAVDADAAVLVGIDHFSERTVTMSGDGDSSSDDSTDDSSDDDMDGNSGDDTSDDDTSDDGSPGFGVVVSLAALLGTVGLLRRR
jgi:PGF-CTERM protein